ncbi:tRNA-binding protein [Legionella sp. W05-934-2]|jgi:tRNA-binding protein|uniref:tRNA-binding protein n=1 Tax=Legionella sp. W05-934-2 TaxID=1198649 RepID=UPI0034627E38
MTISLEDFEKVELRTGTVIKAERFPKARNPSYKIWVDFGEAIGTLQTSAQVTAHYTPEQLVGKQVVGCINLGERNIAGFMSQFLLVGFSDDHGDIVLCSVDKPVQNGMKLH